MHPGEWEEIDLTSPLERVLIELGSDNPLGYASGFYEMPAFLLCYLADNQQNQFTRDAISTIINLAIVAVSVSGVATATRTGIWFYLNVADLVSVTSSLAMDDLITKDQLKPFFDSDEDYNDFVDSYRNLESTLNYVVITASAAVVLRQGIRSMTRAWDKRNPNVSGNSASQQADQFIDNLVTNPALWENYPRVKQFAEDFPDLAIRRQLAQLDDEALSKLNDDLEDTFFRYFLGGSAGRVKAWKKLSSLTGTREWVRKSKVLLEKMSDESDDFMDKVQQYYSTHQKPSGTEAPPFIHQGTPFDNFGHPNFVPEVPPMVGQGKIKYRPEEIAGQPDLNGTGTDMNRANTWAKNTFNQNELKFKEHPTVSGRCYIKSPEHSYADSDGWVECVWHHHEDAKTMIPVPIQTHNRSFLTGSPHTGGASILRNSDLHNLIGFFNSPVGI